MTLKYVWERHDRELYYNHFRHGLSDAPEHHDVWVLAAPKAGGFTTRCMWVYYGCDGERYCEWDNRDDESRWPSIEAPDDWRETLPVMATMLGLGTRP